jgi:hypothetical protein
MEGAGGSSGQGEVKFIGEGPVKVRGQGKGVAVCSGEVMECLHLGSA